MSMITLTVEQKDKFNKYFAEQYQRNVAMSIFASIKYWQDKEVGFLRFSLDKLYLKYKNKFFLTLSNFKKIANKLVSLGLLKTMNKGRLKFYGTYDCKSDDEIREENEKLKRENKALNEDVERLKKEIEDLKREVREKLSVSKDEVVEEKIENKEFEKEVISQDVAIEMTYERMEEVGIEKGSTVFRQIIESMYAKTDKELLHKKGASSYIDKVIHNKVHNQIKFKEMLIKERKSRRKLRFDNFKGRDYNKEKWNRLERKLLGWD